MSYVVGDCSLGEDLKFDIPSDYVSGDLIDQHGYLFNPTSQTIYIYCSQYPDYSFRLPAMSGLEYRTDSYSYVDLPLSIDYGPVLSMSIPSLLLAGILLICSLLIICKGGAKRD